MSGSFSAWSTAAEAKHIPDQPDAENAALTTFFRGRRCVFCAALQKNFFDWRKRPAEYIRKYRLTQAAKQLRSGDTRVIDAAYDAGFSNVDTFTRAFCREFGLNPGEYRKRPVPVPFFIP